MVFERVEVPTVYKTSQELLRKFWKQNPVLHPIGSLLQKNPFPEDGWWCFAFHWNFAIFIEQDRDENQHFVYLKYQSHFNSKWYLIATARQTLDTPLFFTSHVIQKKMHEILVTRNFRLAGSTAETEIPIK